MAANFISLIVPAYKQEKTIIEDIKSLDFVLGSLSTEYEIIVVVDGFLDKTYEKLKEIKNNKVILIGYGENKGKGFAIKLGVEKARGDIIKTIDYHLSIPNESSNIVDIKKLGIGMGIYTRIYMLYF